MKYAFTGSNLIHATEKNSRHNAQTLCGQKVRRTASLTGQEGRVDPKNVSCKACRGALEQGMVLA